MPTWPGNLNSSVGACRRRHGLKKLADNALLCHSFSATIALPLESHKKMTRNDQKEHLGYVFVRAVAYAAGFTVYRPEVDDDSVDLGIAMRGPGQSIRSPRLE